MTDEEMQEYFPTVFPKMFSEKYGGIAVGKGWFDILRITCQTIQSHIDWKNKQRQREIDIFNAREQGYDALLEFLAGSRPATDWEVERAEEYMKTGVTIPPEVSQVIVRQVKEKFGTLRFYYDGGDEYINGVTSLAEYMSAITCETCGDKGEGRNGGWLRTLCDKHEAEYQTRRKDND